MAKFMWQMGDEALAKVTVSLSLLDYCNSLSLCSTDTATEAADGQVHVADGR